jgi:protein-disulfide isomerase
MTHKPYPHLISRAITLLSSALLFVFAASPPAVAASPDEALVEVVMASDLECPFCARAHITIHQLREEYGSKVTFRWLNQPQPYHKRAKAAAIAAEAARNQGKVDAFVDRAFQDTKALEDKDLERHARDIGLDMARFAADLNAPATAERVERDIQIATAIGATGTPTFFINGHPLRGAQPIAKFRELIDRELAVPVTGPFAQHRLDRLKTQNATLHGFLYGNVAPPLPSDPKAVATADKAIYKVTIDRADPTLGDSLATLTLVVFGNYQCPFTRKLEPTLDALREKYGKDLRVVHKQRPLTFHQSAPAAARAALCAHAQNKFEAMHDALITADLVAGQEDELAASLGRTVGLDVSKLAACMADPKTQAKVDRDAELADNVTARGTPNVFINGRKITGARPLDDFDTLIAEQLVTAKKALSNGVPARSLYDHLIADGKVVEVLGSAVQQVDQAGAPRLGNAKAPIQITFFGDLQCPFSARTFPTLAQIVDRHPTKVSVTFHHFPLEFHPQARPAAELAVCGQEQDRFWEVAAYLFEKRESLTDALKDATTTLGLDARKLGACLRTKRPAALVDRQMANGRAIGIRGTPSLYIQGRKWQPVDGYGDALDATVQKHFAAELR